MKNNVKRIAATALAAMMALTSTAGAMAAEYYSGSLNIKRRVVLPAATEEPAQETVAETAAEPTVEPTVEPTAEPAVQPEEVVEDVAEESAAESAEATSADSSGFLFFSPARIMRNSPTATTVRAVIKIATKARSRLFAAFFCWSCIARRFFCRSSYSSSSLSFRFFRRGSG